MSEKDELRVSVDDEINAYDEYLNSAKAIADSVPAAEERKREAEAKKIALDNMPDDVLSECAPKLHQVQKEDDALRRQYFPTLPMVPKQSYFLSPSSGSTATFYEAVVTHVPSGGPAPIWMARIDSAFSSLAQSKTTRIMFPGLIGEVRQDLGQMFALANESVVKAKTGIVGVDQAIVRMRDVIQQLWGALVERTNSQCGDEVRGQHLELKKQSHRMIVANCLALVESRKSLFALLDDLYSLHHDLSPKSKDMLSQDQAILERFHTRWVLQVDALLKVLRQQ